MSRPRLANVIFGAAITLFGAWVWFETRGFPTLRDGHPGPALFPGLISIILMVCGIAVSIAGLSRPAALRRELRSFDLPGARLLRVMVVALLGLLYPLFHAQVGFVPTSAALIFGVAVILRAKVWIAALTTVVGTGVIYFAFTRLLGVPL